MNENYLWDKSGSDAEIQELEDMLSVFRHQGDTPFIAAPINVIAFPRRNFKRRQIFAIAATLAIAVLAGVWFMQFRPNNEVASAVPLAPSAATETKAPTSAHESMPEKQNTAEFSKPAKAKVALPARPKAIKVSYTPANRSRTLRNVGVTAKVTKEEQDAYDQVVLALSITSSKLQVVRDTINRSEGNTDKAVR